jgi:hypothetical protein
MMALDEDKDEYGDDTANMEYDVVDLIRENHENGREDKIKLE